MRGHRKAFVYFYDTEAGVIEESGNGYQFYYNEDYIQYGSAISVNLPVEQICYRSEILFPFFQTIIPEGWYKKIAENKLKIDEHDKFGLLISTCEETVGAVSIRKPAIE